MLNAIVRPRGRKKEKVYKIILKHRFWGNTYSARGDFNESGGFVQDKLPST